VSTGLHRVQLHLSWENHFDVVNNHTIGSMVHHTVQSEHVTCMKAAGPIKRYKTSSSTS